MILEINNLNEIIVKVNDGSGIVLKFESDKKSYVLTAYHNIESSVENNEEIELLNDKNESYLIIGKPYCNVDYDFALLEISYINQDIPIVKDEKNISPDDKIMFMGYPDKGEGRRKDLSGKVNEWNQTKTAVKVIEEDMKGSFVVKEKTNEVIVGFSGSGVFKKDGQKLSLIGILKSSPEEDFDYKEMSCVPISIIWKFIENHKLAELNFSNPSIIAWNEIEPKERNLEDKLKVCSDIRPARISKYIRMVAVGKGEQSMYSQRDISSIKYMIWEECHEELMDFIDEDKLLTFEEMKNLMNRYLSKAKQIIDDKREEYRYGNFSNDIIEKIILDLIDECYLSFDEEGIYE